MISTAQHNYDRFSINQNHLHLYKSQSIETKTNETMNTVFQLLSNNRNHVSAYPRCLARIDDHSRIWCHRSQCITSIRTQSFDPMQSLADELRNVHQCQQHISRREFVPFGAQRAG